jgi:hypothetical protein
MRAYGFTPEEEPVPEEIAVLTETMERYVAPESINSLLADLEARGIRTSTGTVWSRPTLRRRWADPRLRKLVGWRLWDKVQKKMKATKSTAGAPGRRYLATGGKARCWNCGQPLRAQPNDTGQRGYACRSQPGSKACGKVRIMAEPFETTVTTALLARLVSPHIRAQLQAHAEEVTSLPERRESAAQRLRELAEDYAAGEISREFMRESEAHARKRIADLDEAMRHGERLGALLDITPEFLAERWQAMSLDERRDMLDVVVDFIEVFPATKPGSNARDDDRVKIHWR